MKTLLFLYNPHAGKARVAAHLHDTIQTLQQAGFLVTVYATTGPRDAVQVARTLGPRFDRMVCAGGDGTLSEVITGLLDTDFSGSLGYLPAGSTNDFARTLGLPVAESAAAQIAAAGEPTLCDVGRFNIQTFVYIAAFGVFTAVSYETPQQVKNVLGHLAYVLEGIRSLAEITPYHLRLQWDEGELEGNFIYGAITNSVSVGGFHFQFSPVVLDDGLFEVILVRQPDSLAALNDIISALITGRSDDSVLAFQSTRIAIQSAQEIPWTLDGENGGRHCVVDIQNRHNAISLLCPPKQ